ncbi:dipeptide epimerase [Adhaeribacter pallidiroseus]|uniref:Dipeptide epimerase n=1 Tax=Adhaeribacter pallidiroseus TaxID=2072847 RepID=A0A369QJE0_9BACT|nr:dipeptide epimerase [Adhaeribacter pallidiroseus]RDC64834.1 Glutamate racemase [Adhaeribacter pallidiroseus]
MLSWHLESRELHLRYTWKIARNASDSKINLFVRVSEELLWGMGEAAPNIRYQETPEVLQKQFQDLLRQGLTHVQSLAELQDFLKFYPVANSLRFAVESAYVHLLCAQQNISVSQFLGIRFTARVPTIFTLPIMAPTLITNFIRENNLNRFQTLKVKVNQTDALALVQATAAVSTRPLIIDGNEAWNNPEEVLVFLHQLKGLPVVFIEQPLPAYKTDEYRYLKKHSPYPVFADESVTDQPDFSMLRDQFHGVNMKLMKAGGYLNGLRILQETQAQGLLPMIGCMVETSLGIWSAMQLCAGIRYADLDGFLILKEEPMGLVREQDGDLIASDYFMVKHL